MRILLLDITYDRTLPRLIFCFSSRISSSAWLLVIALCASKQNRTFIRCCDEQKFSEINYCINQISIAPYGITSEAQGTCERLAQVRYSAMRRPGVELATC